MLKRLAKYFKRTALACYCTKPCDSQGTRVSNLLSQVHDNLSTLTLFPSMGFSSSFISGFTLTSTVVWLSLLHHQRSRSHQASILHASSQRLETLVDPQLTSTLATMNDENYSGGLREGINDYRLMDRGYWERFKDGWNRELESGMQRVLGSSFSNVGRAAEERLERWATGEKTA